MLEAENPPAGPVFAWNPEPEPPPPPAWSERMVAIQPWKPTHDRLLAAGWRCLDTPPSGATAAIVRLGRSRERGLADVAAALDALAPGGRLIVAGDNDHGAAASERRLAALLGAPRSSHRRRARAARFLRPANLSADLESWRALGRLRPILDGAAVSAPGLFAWDRIDPGTALLIEQLPPALGARVADLGAGWGALSRAALARADVARLDAYEADALAVAAARCNLADPRARVIWHDVAGGLPETGYDWILTNPPFHDDRAADTALGLAFIAAAAAALAPGGTLLLVANRTLPYEGALAARLTTVDRVAERDGYKVLRARR